MSGDSELSEADVLAIPTLFDPETCARKGLCPVTQIRNKGDPFESHSLYFEQHGTGPEKILFIMGLSSTLFSWGPQVEYFGRKPEYSVLVFDNRGVGNSGAPRGPYTTSGMAEDTIALLNYVGWTADNDVHVVGSSLGGMIAQELSTRIPERIISMTLAVTRSKGSLLSVFPSLHGCYALARLMVTRTDAKLPIILGMLFPPEWLDAKADNDLKGRTNRELQAEEHYKRLTVVRPQPQQGALSQMAAALTHDVSANRLRKISATIPKIIIMTGTKDKLVDPAGSRWMAENMPEAEFVVWEGVGHALQVQCSARYNETLARVIREGRERLLQKQTDFA